MKTVLITGSARGLGLATAELFHQKGFRVVATDVSYMVVKDHRPAKEWVELPNDITSADEVEKLAGTLKEMGITIDVLVNNAGKYDIYPLVETDSRRVEEMISNNALGSLRMIRAFLPDLVGSGGRVIQVSSESVRFPGLFQPYQISKITLEALSRSVRQELALKGVKMAIIRPGAIRTEFYSHLWQKTNSQESASFGEEFAVFHRNTVRFIGKVATPQQVARVIYKAANAGKPKYIYRINNNPLLTVLSLLPDRWIDRLVIMIIRRGQKRRT